MENTIIQNEPTVVSPQVSNSNPSKLLIGGLMLLLPIVGLFGYYLGSRNSPVNTLPSTSPIPIVNQLPTTTPTATSISTPQIKKTANQYVNQEYGITFDLQEGERVVECPSVDEINNNIALWIVTNTLPEGVNPKLECATEGSPDAIFMSKTSAGPQTIDEQITLFEKSGYVLSKSPITVAGINGIQVSGSRDASVPAPIPVTIDKMIFEKNDALYVIPTIFKSRNFTFTN